MTAKDTGALGNIKIMAEPTPVLEEQKLIQLELHNAIEALRALGFTIK